MTLRSNDWKQRARRLCRSTSIDKFLLCKKKKMNSRFVFRINSTESDINYKNCQLMIRQQLRDNANKITQRKMLKRSLTLRVVRATKCMTGKLLTQLRCLLMYCCYSILFFFEFNEREEITKKQQ